MPMEDGPYEILGLRPTASREEIRRAYRRLALRLHPDSHIGEPAEEAVKAFRQVTKAYRFALRAADRRSSRVFNCRTLKPQDFTRRANGQKVDVFEAAGRSAKAKWRGHPGAHRFSYARLNEPAVFICIWAVAVALAVIAFDVLLKIRMGGRFREQLTTAELAGLAVMAMGIYAGLMAAGAILLILTRKIVYLIPRLWFDARRLLPRARKKTKLPA